MTLALEADLREAGTGVILSRKFLTSQLDPSVARFFMSPCAVTSVGSKCAPLLSVGTGMSDRLHISLMGSHGNLILSNLDMPLNSLGVFPPRLIVN